MRKIQEDLFSMQDIKYREFNSKLVPNIDYKTIIGVRTPSIRKYAKDIAGSSNAVIFLNTLPHEFFEENNLHGYLIEQIKDFEKVIYETERFLPYIDNWATCDTFFPPVFKKNTDKLYLYAGKWINSGNTYIVRYGIGILMRLYLDDEFSPEFLALVASLQSTEYYVNMMIAWYFATALAKQYTFTIPYITERRLSAFVHNKTIQKAVESRRISNETKLFLKTLKV